MWNRELILGRKDRRRVVEPPEWFGISVVVLYVVGMAAIGYVGVVQVRNDSAQRETDLVLQSVHSLASEISAICNLALLNRAQHGELPPRSSRGAEPSESISETPKPRGAMPTARTVMTEYAQVSGSSPDLVEATDPTRSREYAGFPEFARLTEPLERRLQAARGRLPIARALVLDEEGRILAAVGDHVAADSTAPTLVAPNAASAIVTVRTPFLVSVPSEAVDAKLRTLYLETKLVPPAKRPWTLIDQAPELTVIGAALGVLFVAYRRVSGQLRGPLRIASQLRLHSGRIENDLKSLLIADSADAVTVAWNRLIAAAQGWSDANQRSTANSELARVLQKGSAHALADAIHAFPDAFMLITQEVRIEYANMALRRLLGWTSDDVHNYTVPDAPAQSNAGSKLLSMIRQSLRPDGSYEPRTEVITTDAELGRDESCYRVQIIPLHRNGLDGACMVHVRDASQQIRADRAREEFVAQVTHELRTPLTNIRAYAETLASGMFDDPKVITDCYNVIMKETRRLSRLIEDILSVSQLEVGSIELVVHPVDLTSLLTEAVRDVRGLAEEKNIDVQASLPSKLEPIDGDRDKLAVVVNNLLGNAIKYTPSDGNVVVGCQISSNAVVITVKDNGIGIDPAEHARVFEKFQRGSDPQALNESGTGIGLFTAREIVRRHGGDIELMSEKGMGATFMVKLPRRESRAGASPTHSAA